MICAHCKNFRTAMIYESQKVILESVSPNMVKEHLNVRWRAAARPARACPEKVARLFRYLEIGYIRCLVRTCSNLLILSDSFSITCAWQHQMCDQLQGGPSRHKRGGIFYEDFRIG